MQEDLYFKVKKLDSRAVIPSKREEDAGYDFYALFDEDIKILKKGEIWISPTGLSMEFPKNWVLYIAERGSTGSKGISRRCGVIDSGYRGELKILLNNTSTKDIAFVKSGINIEEKFLEMGLKESEITIYPQEKAIAQGMLLYAPHVEVEEVEELDNTSQRGDGVFGSSGK